MGKESFGVLSWVFLLVGLLYLLMVPLGVADTWRMYHANNAQIGYKVSQQRQQLQQIKGQLNQAQKDKWIKQVVTSLTPLSWVRGNQSEQSIQNQAKIAQTKQTQALSKNSVKWNLGALVSGTLFIWIWDLTDWARRKEY